MEENWGSHYLQEGQSKVGVAASGSDDYSEVCVHPLHLPRCTTYQKHVTVLLPSTPPKQQVLCAGFSIYVFSAFDCAIVGGGGGAFW